ncbi:methionyl-tRNA formyltransferase [Lacicoccus alkaliphilus]|uniref:UDP-4-amino-4-deoxy-L-arabinose formyltransferase / UDP-glucuronic acid dehydrogenase (UDP-4-keto-hexauronic acid decarboxylating) n=1 Tax=Lacicoccus alkaliphilus DSM 16010 TaxID=1123231 RepID=A0A1M7FVG4_9BACL|nr:methionyl-tRNA formyltransferase [Salinicoccus alkaliphilus]SHM08112.1 UDP-4-amino-4-deoxy-L-arabinose formyltransferase / UDP-glucuronic acid dehydrogenase (UDP-4-keto-hexauronic acid decarboxylating) [Salinicoccus alkaliphilus DSM 16010]
MNYILFISSRLGLESLMILLQEKINIKQVFIEKEHEHELRKYYKEAIEICDNHEISCSVNASIKEISELLYSVDFTIDYIMSFGYRRMIPDEIVKMAKVAALGTHFSPLPQYRGFAPLNWLLINGESETAVNLFYLDKEVDNGDIIATESVEIKYEDDINTLFERCLKSFKKTLIEVIPQLENNSFKAIKQDNSKASYTCARTPEDGKINWNQSSFIIYNLIRALTNPFPGAFTYYKGSKLTILSSEEYNEGNYIGRVEGRVVKIIKNKGVVVLCGKGSLLIKDVMLENSDNKISADKIITSVRGTLS